MNIRKDPLVNGEIYHVFSRSIADYKIFNSSSDFSRIIKTIVYYQKEKPQIKFSRFLELVELQPYYSELNNDHKDLVDVVTYCVMPTHIHLILKQLENNGISIFMKNVLNSYTRYFNTKYHRKGPLCESRFKNVLVKQDRQLLHLTRYFHLNPTTAGLVKRPEDWPWSSYKEYLGEGNNKICDYEKLIDLTPKSYKKFVEERVDYQKELAKIKKLILE